VNGDVTQIDLPPGRRSGLLDALDVLRGVDGISFVNFDERDVVRHTLVQRIVRAYEKYNEMVGAGRQLTLRLAENAPEVPPDAVAASPDAAPSAGVAASLQNAASPAASPVSSPVTSSVTSPATQPASVPGAPNA